MFVRDDRVGHARPCHLAQTFPFLCSACFAPSSMYKMKQENTRDKAQERKEYTCKLDSLGKLICISRRLAWEPGPWVEETGNLVGVHRMMKHLLPPSIVPSTWV